MGMRKQAEELWQLHLEQMKILYQAYSLFGTRGENGVLLYLQHMARPMFPGELTNQLGLTTGRIANILKVLEQQGLVTRERDTVDRRRTLVKLTPKGEEVARQKSEAGIRRQEKMLEKFTDTEVDTMLQMVRHYLALAVQRGL